jgi:hypothetical protein
VMQERQRVKFCGIAQKKPSSRRDRAGRGARAGRAVLRRRCGLGCLVVGLLSGWTAHSRRARNPFPPNLELRRAKNPSPLQVMNGGQSSRAESPSPPRLVSTSPHPIEPSRGGGSALHRRHALRFARLRNTQYATFVNPLLPTSSSSRAPRPNLSQRRRSKPLPPPTTSNSPAKRASAAWSGSSG